MKDTENNWLSEQIEFEKKKSFWNLDDRRNLEREHAENCDARQEEKRHRLEHYHIKNIAESYKGEQKSNFFMGCVIINALLCSFGAFAGLWSFVYMLQFMLPVFTLTPILMLIYGPTSNKVESSFCWIFVCIAEWWLITSKIINFLFFWR